MGDHEEASLDKILKQYVGGAGRYQFLNTFAMAWVYYAGLYALFLTLFTAYAPTHRCHISQCEAFNESDKVTSDIFNQDWLEHAIPSEQSTSNYLAADNEFDQCLMFNVSEDAFIPTLSANEDQCVAETFANETIACQNYVYDNTYFDETLTTKLDLVCGNEYLKDSLGTILIIGLLFGSLSGGILGDKFGRKKACFGAIALIVPVTIAAGHVQSYIGNQKLF